MIQRWHRISGLILALIVLLLLVGCSPVTGAFGASKPPVARIGEKAPDFQLQDLEGNTMAMDGLTGRPVMLNFWATWCPPCRDEMPLIQQVYEEWTGKPPSVVVLTINMGESKAEVERYLQSQNLSLPVLLDTRQDVAEKYSITAIPTTFFIDADGVIRDIKIGAFWNKEQIEGYLDKIVP